MKLSDFQLGYLAGLIDGEGHITAKFCPGASSVNRIRIGITNTNLEVLEYIREILKTGFISQRKRKPPNQTCYQLIISKRSALEELATLLEGKLIIKREQLSTLKAHLSSYPQKHFPKPWTEKEIEYLKANYRRMSCREIGENLNRGKESVQAKLKELKVKKGRMTEKQEKLREQALELFEQHHYSTRKIAKLIGASKTAVGYWLWGKWTTYRKDLKMKAIKLHEIYRAKQIAQIIDVPEGTVGVWLWKHRKEAKAI